MAHNFFVIEGLDGSGKSTQLKLLKERLTKNNIKFKSIHFPSFEEGYYGQIIAEYLRGDFGNLEQIHPKLVALMFAGDRKEHGEKIIKWIANDYLVIADRYVNSNIAFQCAKCKEIEEKRLLHEWILEFEYNFNKIPKPTLSIFLDVPLDLVKKSITNNRSGDERKYLNGKRDIHEDSISLQEKVRIEYLKLVKEQEDFHLIECYDKDQVYLSQMEIHKKVLKKILTKIFK